MMRCNIEAADTKVKGPDKPFLAAVHPLQVAVLRGIARGWHSFGGPGHGAFPAGRPLSGPLHRIDPRT